MFWIFCRQPPATKISNYPHQLHSATWIWHHGLALFLTTACKQKTAPSVLWIFFPPAACNTCTSTVSFDHQAPRVRNLFPENLLQYEYSSVILTSPLVLRIFFSPAAWKMRLVSAILTRPSSACSGSFFSQSPVSPFSSNRLKYKINVSYLFGPGPFLSWIFFPPTACNTKTVLAITMSHMFWIFFLQPHEMRVQYSLYLLTSPN